MRLVLPRVHYLGMYIENRIAVGTLLVLAIIPDHSEDLTKSLHEAGYGVTRVDGLGANGPVKLIYTIVFRRNLDEVLSIIHRNHPHAFLTIEDLRSTQQGIFPLTMPTRQGVMLGRKFK